MLVPWCIRLAWIAVREMQRDAEGRMITPIKGFEGR
jgi:hypothetical protein